MKLSKEISEKCTLDAGEAYKDMEGNMRQFTHVDHDPKTSKTLYISTEEESQARREWLVDYHNKRILELLALPAVCIAGKEDGRYDYLVERTSAAIIWNEKAVRDTMDSDPHLAYWLPLLAWKSTVREAHWFDPIREDHEAIIRGDWKSLM